MLRLDSVSLANYRCFGDTLLRLESDCTLLHAENAGGKTAMLNALALGLACWLTPSPIVLHRERDIRHVRTPTGSWEPAGDCVVAFQGRVDGVAEGWVRELRARGGRTSNWGVKRLRDAAEAVLVPGRDWPIVAFYGTQRLWKVVKQTKAKARPRHRWDGYTDALDPRSSEAQLLDWMFTHEWADIQRSQRGEPRGDLLRGVVDAMVRATPRVTAIWFDFGTVEPRVRFDDASEAGWGQLSDGYHIFLALVADIARRCVTLNDHLGAEAPWKTGGVVLIDEIDLHLHPRWQRRVVEGLRAAFPAIQFVLTTHSPQVLGSVENRQVRRLADGAVSEGTLFVEGRDTNAILRDAMGEDERSPRGSALLRELFAAIDASRIGEAERKLADLRALWGSRDPEVVRAEAMLDWQR